MSRESALYNDIGAWMRERRLENGLSIKEAAHITKWTPAKLTAYEAGAPITVAQLENFAKRFLIAREELIDPILEFDLGMDQGEH